jgi:AcrR family transcriptional regulator
MQKGGTVTQIDKVRSLDASTSRTRQILRIAREAFLQHGWDGFSIELIAEWMGCSRPLVYKHFPCKEEILLALAIQSKARRVELAERAVLFRGRPREKMLAIGEVEVLLAPRDLPVELLVASTSLRAKTSRQRQDDLQALDVRAIGLTTSVVREAIADGDLTLPSKMCPEDLTFVLWSSLWGAYNLILSDTPLQQAGVARPELAQALSTAVMLDGYGWKPLSGEWNYKETRRRVHAEAFPPDLVARVLSSGEEVELDAPREGSGHGDGNRRPKR